MVIVDPSTEAVKALDGKIFAMLSEAELKVLEFYQKRGRKYGVSVGFASEGELAEPTQAIEWTERGLDLLRRTSCRVRVTVAS
jgi:hypothetical protein